MSPNIAMFAPIIRTERLTLRRYNPETDNQFLLDLLNSSRSQMPTDPAWETKDLLRLFRNVTLSPQNCLGLTPPGPVFYIVHLGDENGEPIGNVGLAERSPDIAPDIGYAIMPSHRQKGYATEAALALKDYMISFGFKEMTGFCLPTNEPSNAILRKLGFETAGEALVNGKVIVNAYVLPGMKHCTAEETRFNRMGVDK